MFGCVGFLLENTIFTSRISMEMTRTIVGLQDMKNFMIIYKHTTHQRSRWYLHVWVCMMLNNNFQICVWFRVERRLSKWHIRQKLGRPSCFSLYRAWQLEACCQWPGLFFTHLKQGQWESGQCFLLKARFLSPYPSSNLKSKEKIFLKWESWSWN
jgi:hypothetical protein